MFEKINAIALVCFNFKCKDTNAKASANRHVRDVGRDDRFENRVTAHTTTRRQTRRPTRYVRRDENVRVLQMFALPFALAYVVALRVVCFGNDQIVCLKNQNQRRAGNRVSVLYAL